MVHGERLNNVVQNSFTMNFIGSNFHVSSRLVELETTSLVKHALHTRNIFSNRDAGIIELIYLTDTQLNFDRQ